MSEGRQHKKSCGARQMRLLSTGQNDAGSNAGVNAGVTVANHVTSDARVGTQRLTSLNEMD